MNYTLTIEGVIVPKARPRFAKGHSYLPDRYRQWKDAAIFSLRGQWGDKPPIDRARVEIALRGAHRGDLDNLAGSILDALVQSSVLLDDRLTVVPWLCVCAKPGDKGADIWLEPIG